MTLNLNSNNDALEAIVDKAMERKTGARGLRSIMEETMRDVMYEVPSNYKIAKCVITKDTVVNKEKPELVIDENKKEKARTVKRTNKNVSNQETA